MTQITQNGIVVDSVQTDSVQIGGNLITGISYSPDDVGVNKVAGSLSVYQAVSDLQEQIQEVASTADGPGFTDSIVSSTFESVDTNPTLGWSIQNWTVDVTGATIDANPFHPDNFLRIPQARYPDLRKYFLLMSIPEIDGVIKIYQNGVEIGSASTTGKHGFAFTITNLVSDDVYIAATSVTSGQRIRISSAAVLGVPQTLDDYIQYMIDYKVDNLQILDQTSLNAAFAAHIAASDPHSQYFLRKDGRNLTRANIAFPPNKAIALLENWIPAPIIVRSTHLMHDTDGPYDPASGYIYADKQCVGSIGRMVNGRFDTNNRRVRFSRTDLATITYRFHESRVVDSIELYIDEPGLANITQIQVFCGSQMKDMNLSAGITGSQRIVPVVFTAPATGTELVIVVSNVNSSGPYYSIGFDITYGDVVIGDVVVRHSFSGIAGSPSGPQAVDTAVSLPIPVGSMVSEHAYDLYLIDNNNTQLSGIPYGYGIDGACTYPLREYFSTDTTYFGSCASSTGPANPWLFYQDNKSAPIEVGDFTLTQTFVVYNPLYEIGIVVDDASRIVNMTVTLTKENNSQVVYTLNQMDRRIRPGDDLVYLGGLSSQGNIKAVAITVDVLDGNTVGVCQINIGFVAPVFDDTAKKWSDGYTRTVLGTIIKYSAGGFGFDPVSYNGKVSIPLNGMTPTDFGYTYKVSNPFRHNLIDIESSSDVMDIRVTPETIAVVAGDDLPTVITCKSVF